MFKHVLLSSFNNKVFTFSNSSDFLKPVTYVVNKNNYITQRAMIFKGLILNCNEEHSIHHGGENF